MARFSMSIIWPLLVVYPPCLSSAIPSQDFDGQAVRCVLWGEAAKVLEPVESDEVGVVLGMGSTQAIVTGGAG